MTVIDTSRVKFLYIPEEKTFIISEREIRFDTEYEIYNPKTGVRKEFNFTHSTGPEFDPATAYVYANEEGYSLWVTNDATITANNEEAYLKAKLRN